MGNCSCANSRNNLNCFGKSSKRRKGNKSAGVLPEDLHASSGQECQTDVKSSMVPRPSSLEVQAVAHEESSSKFPAFSLHGIQKSSPSTCGNDSPVVGSSQEKVELGKVEILFENYRDSTSDAVLAEGVERFCLDLKVDPTEFIVLALAWKFKAETMCKFTRKEFIDGFLELRCDSIEGLRSTFEQIEADASDKFKDLYRYTFQFALDADQGQRSLPCNIATAMWDVVFSRKPPALLQPWLDFLQESNIRGISRDTWNMFLYLSECLNDDLSNYNDNEAWPSLFDDFVDYQRERLKETKIETLSSDRVEIPALQLNDDIADQVTQPALPFTKDVGSAHSSTEIPESIPTSSEISGSISPPAEIAGSISPPAEIAGSISPSTEIPGSIPPPTEISGSISLPTEIPGSIPPPTEISGSISPPTEIPGSIPPPTEISGSISPPTEISGSISPPTDIGDSTSPSPKIQDRDTGAAGGLVSDEKGDENEDLMGQLHAAMPDS